MNKIRILFIIPSLSAGGAERIISFLASNLNKKDFLVRLIVLGNRKTNKYDVSNVDVKYLEKNRLLTSVHLVIREIYMFKPNIVFGTIGHINILLGVLAFFLKKISFVGRESSVFSYRIKFTNINTKLMSYLIRKTYPQLRLIICQSNDMKDDLQTVLKINSSKIKVVNNPITINRSIGTRKQSKEIRFITIGRLSEEKGILRIIKCLSKIKENNFVYTLIGDGPMRDEIISEIKRCGLIDKVNYIRYTAEVLEELAKNDYFLQGSYVEGLPNTLLESCSVGTPFIAFNAPGGTKEIHESKVNGYLVENENEFVQKLKMVSKEANFDREKVRKSVMNKFSQEKILLKYESLLKGI